MVQGIRKGKFIRVLAIAVAVPIVLLWALLFLLYLPPVQEYAIRKISEAVAANSDFEINVGSVGLSFPLKLAIKDFLLTQKEDTIAEGEEIAVSVGLLPLLKGEIEVDYLSLENIAVDTRGIIENTRIKGKVGYLRTVARGIDLVAEKANIKQLNLHDTEVNIDIAKSNTAKESSTPLKWVFELQKSNIENVKVAVNIPADSLSIATSVGEFNTKGVVADIGNSLYSSARLEIEGTSFLFDNAARRRSGTAPVAINGITLQGKNITYHHPIYAAKIEKLAFAQDGGITITEGKLTIEADEKGVNIPVVDIMSANGTFINGKALLPLDIKTATAINADITAHVERRDTEMFFVTRIKGATDSLLDARILLSGTTADVKIDTATITIPQIAAISLNGRAKNITDNRKREATLTLNGEITNSNAFTGHKSTATPAPLFIEGEAKLQGDLCYTNLLLTGKGEGEITAFYDINSGSYDTKVATDELDINASLPALPLTKLTMRAALSGQGIDIFDGNTYYQLIADIDSLHYNRSALSDITMSAYQANNIALLSMQSYNRDADLTLLSSNHIDTLKITTDTKLNIKHIDLAALGLGNEPVSGGINVEIKAQSDLHETHSLKLKGSDIVLDTGKKRYTPAPLDIDIATAPDGSHINARNGDFTLNGRLEGGYTQLLRQLEGLQAMLQHSFTQKEPFRITELGNILPATEIRINCGRDNIVANLLAVQGVDFDDVQLTAALDSINGIALHGKADRLSAAGFKSDTIKINVRQRGDNIVFNTMALNRAKEKKEQFTAAIRGELQKDTLNTDIFFKGHSDESKTSISSTTYIMPQKLDIRFAPSAYFLGTPITINRDNHISIGKEYAVSANLTVTDRNKAGLHLYTIEDSTAKHDITLELYNIDLGTLTGTMPFAPDIAGRVNCDIHYRNDNSGEMFSGDIRGDSIAYDGTYIGNEIVEAVYLPKKSGSHYLALLLHHDEEEVLNLHGDYNDNSKMITGETTITHFPLKIANAFIKESNLDINGHLDGYLTLDGNITAPRSDGYIRFDSVNLDAPLLGSRLRLVNDKVEIKENRMMFDNFNIYAKGDTPFNIDGNIDFSNLLTPLFDIRMRARNYALVDARRQKNSIVYGNLNININSTIKGPANSLRINGGATILGNTNVTYVMEESGIANNNEFDGLVEFVNFKEPASAKPKEEMPQLGNITMAITLDIEESAWINADLTPDRSSYIQLQGGGLLNMNYNNEEGLTLTGRYTLNNGEMKYSLPVIPLKTFNISPGSYVYWTGDALNPTLHITALERVVAPVSIDGGNSQPVAFDVGVDLSNSLDDMGLNFTMRAPENAVIQDELNALDTETMNKYAVTMLITGAYVGSKGGLTVSNALTSFLDAKINDIAGSAMKDVSINVGIADVENEETGGSYMNYSFSFAKRFWNDRLTIVVGGEVNSGDRPDNNQSFINNISLEWKISNSGNRYLRIFYDKNYESILEGEITETGVGYVYKRKFNNLNELLYFKKRDKEPAVKSKKANEE